MTIWLTGAFVALATGYCLYRALRCVVGIADVMRRAMNATSKYDEESADLFARAQRRKAIEAHAERRRREQEQRERQECIAGACRRRMMLLGREASVTGIVAAPANPGDSFYPTSGKGSCKVNHDEFLWRKKTCLRKRDAGNIYPSRKKARAALHEMRRRRGKDEMRDVQIFRCAACLQFHLGQPTPRDKSVAEQRT